MVLRKTIIFVLSRHMNFASKYYSILFTFFIAILTSCSVGNKVIPDSAGNSDVDTTNTTLNSFKVYVTGDTSFVMTITTVDSINTLLDDSLIVSGFELNGAALAGLVGFKTYSSSADSYLVEGAPPGITQAEFGLIKTINGVRRLYTMNHGTVTITSHDFVTKTVKGRFDVNNEYNITADRFFKCKGYFYIKYQ